MDRWRLLDRTVATSGRAARTPLADRVQTQLVGTLDSDRLETRLAGTLHTALDATRPHSRVRGLRRRRCSPSLATCSLDDLHGLLRPLGDLTVISALERRRRDQPGATDAQDVGVLQVGSAVGG